ncbi:hypothetical protein [Pseudonocardia alni]|uniref:hypothetical protein n=1 Tax=Pseudonocardia alni TaxID=33907 RepID=UPI00280C2D01|nr:hypothetical protein [Pseudonocardia alni]
MTPPLRYQPGSDPTEMIEEWLARPALRAMVEASSGTWPSGGLQSRLDQLVEFSSVWDRRNGDSRLAITATERSYGQSEQVLGWAAALGLVDVAAPSGRDVDTALVLGGLVTGCVSRVDYLRDLMKNGRVHVEQIALLGSFRQLQDQERELADEVAPGATTEVDVLMALGADLDPRSASWDVTSTGDPVTDPRGAELAVHRGEQPSTWVFAARSSDPGARPANTADTYRQAASALRFGAGTRLLLVTTHIYATYQHWDAVRVLGLPLGVELETIGTPPGASRRVFSSDWYAQEVRSTLRSARALVMAWAEG